MTIFNRKIGITHVSGFLGAIGIICGAIMGPTQVAEWWRKKSMEDLNGPWSLTTVIENSSLERYKGLELGYKVFIKQDGEIVDISGEKYLENGTEMAFSSRTRINMSGKYDGYNLKLQVNENGKRRQTIGSMNFLFKDKKKKVFEGRFTSTAANASGTCLLTYLEN